MNWYLFFDVIAWVVAVFGGLAIIAKLIDDDILTDAEGGGAIIFVVLSIAYLIARL